MKLIEVKNLIKNYETVEAVKNIDFHVNEGEFIGFLGPNGAGKSTTISVLSTLIGKTSGSVSVCGYELDKDDDAIRKNIGVVFQDSMLDKELSVETNLSIRASLYGYKKSEINVRIARIVKDFELNDILKQSYGTLSGGQRRRVDIARALIHNPRMLFLDEPTTGLDPKTRKLVWKILNALIKKGLTIILTTHYMEEVINCDRIIVIDKGEIVDSGSPEQLRSKYTSDSLKIVGDLDPIIKGIKDTYKYKVNADLLTIDIKKSKVAIDIINSYKEYITDFEVIRGTMDNVFLTITGRKLEE